MKFNLKSFTQKCANKLVDKYTDLHLNNDFNIHSIIILQTTKQVVVPCLE
jgi:hypothetical protein